MKKERKTRYTLKRVCDDLLVGFVIGYVITAILNKFLEKAEVIPYNYFQPFITIVGIVIFILCVIRYKVEKIKESKQ